MFNRADYHAAVSIAADAEKISAVLYPNNSTEGGKELRFKKQPFFASTTLQDIVRRFRKINRPLTELDSKVAVQLNDTHPTIAIVELIRILMDDYGLVCTASWTTTNRVFSYTYHTVLSQALEKWSVSLIQRLLPRHVQIIYEIDGRYLEKIAQKYPNEGHKLQRMSIIEDGYPKMVYMANFAVVGSHIVNGVIPRPWVQQANPALSTIISRWLETDEWVIDSSKHAHSNNT